MINSIEFVDDINSVSKEFERKAKILSVIKTVANIKEPLSEKSIKEGIIKAKEYGFDTKILAQTIENLKTKNRFILTLFQSPRSRISKDFLLHHHLDL